MKEKKSFLANPVIAIVIAIICWAIWGSAFPLIKKCYALFSIEGIASPLLFGGLRFVVAGILLLIIVTVKDGKFPVQSKENMLSLVKLGSVQTGLVYFFEYIALNYCSGVNSSIVNALQPLFLTIFAHLLFKNDKITVRKILGIIIGFAGVLVCLLGSEVTGISFKGEGLIMISAMMFSLGSNMSKKVAGKVNPVVTSGYNLLIGGAEITVIGLAMGGKMSNGGVQGFVFFGCLVLISSLCFMLWTSVCKLHPVGKLAPMQFVNPVTGTILSAVLLGENAFQPRYIIALALVSIGIVTTTLNLKKTA